MQKTFCPYCGNNPVPHLVYWYNESLNVLLTPIRQKLLYNFLTKRWKRGGLGQGLGRGFVSLGLRLGVFSWQNSMADCKVPRARVLWQEAQSRGIVMSELKLFGRPLDSYMARGRGITIVFSGLPRPSGYSNNVLDIMDDKWLFKKMMLRHNLPVPLGASCWTFGQARKIFRQIQAAAAKNNGVSGGRHQAVPVIVKPRAGSRGRHSTTFVYTEQDLRQAFKVAKQLCFWVMVEQQLMGPVYRATVVDFKLEGVLRGDAPQVLGDGLHTLAELVAKKNSDLHPGVKDIILDGRAAFFLSRQGLDFSSVVERGRTVSISEKIGVNYGGSSSEDFEVCHPDNKQLFVAAARALGDPIVGFDFIIADIKKSYKQQSCGFIEVNSLPFINLHHDPLLGKPRNVAAAVWDMVGF